jgi:hypothetical protein
LKAWAEETLAVLEGTGSKPRKIVSGERGGAMQDSMWIRGMLKTAA